MKSTIGQHIMIGVSGQTLTSDEKKFIVDNGISGVTLFGRNCVEPKQIYELCKEIQSLHLQMKEKIPLFIAIDMEGGRVARLKAPFTQWPPLRKLGDLDSPTASFHFSYMMGQELSAVGINLDFAPCLDIFTNPENKVIGDRSVSSDPEMVSKHGSALIRGYIKSDIIACGKHFPGHGNTLIDSHEDLPIEQADLTRLESVEFIPFKKVFRSRLELLMTAHIRFPNIDPVWPATLSEIFIQKILKESLKYRGLIISDDLGMKALAKNYDKALIPVRALQAGVDILLYCNEFEVPPVAVAAIEKALNDGELKKQNLEQSFKKIVQLKRDFIKNVRPMDWADAAKLIGHADHFKLAQAIQAGEVPPGLIAQV